MRPKTFMYRSKEYQYWRNNPGERIVEVPIFWDMISSYPAADILEVGNVLAHYYEVHHIVVDKYEKSDNVINEDALTFDIGKRYKLIISISTIEHVGTLKDPPQDPAKTGKTLNHLKTLLAPGGKVMVSLPLGWNRNMDERIKAGIITFDKTYCLKRISAENAWTEATWEGIKDAKYNKPFGGANGLLIGEIDG